MRNNSTPRFSLILATLGRVDELDRCLHSLLSQSMNQLEIIIVDQNTDSRVEQILASIQGPIDFIIHHKVNFKGLSRARNFGLSKARGEIIAFPDDDCYYPEDLLEKVDSFFKKNNYDFFSCRVLDPKRNIILTPRCPTSDKKIDQRNIFYTLMSVSLFIKSKSIANSRFDDHLGAGTSFSSAEENDFVLRLIEKNKIGYFTPSIDVYHPFYEIDFGDADQLKKHLSYAKGLGAFFRKNLNFSLLIPFFEALFVRPIGGMLLNINDKKQFFKNYLSLKGRWQGFISYGKL